MKSLVTGATGVVGSNLVRALLQQGHEVRVLLRPSSDNSALRRLAVERWTGDVLDEQSLAGVADGCEFVFHAAAVFAYSGYARGDLEDIAVRGTRNVLAAAAAARVKRVVVTSSTVVLGSGATPEVRDETSEHNDKYPSSYTQSKIHQEQAALETARELGLNVVIVCPGLTIGAHDYRLSPSNASIVNYLNDPLRSTFPGGCNIVAARDVAAGHIVAAQCGDDGARYVVGGENLRWRDVHGLISKLCGTFGPSLKLNHTATYMAAAIAEASARLAGAKPSVTRDEAAMACRFYWYSSAALERLGYRPGSGEEALAESLAWLIHRAYLNDSVLERLVPGSQVLDRLQLMSGVAA
jgi:dihydroflavonol-4-reductase